MDKLTPTMLISAEKLHSILNDTDLVIVDTRSFKEYSEDHIPGAVNLDLFAFHWIDTTSEGIKNFNKQTETLFSFAGITNQTKNPHRTVSKTVPKIT